MTLPVPFRFALRELRGGLRGFYIFLACLALGVAAIAAVGTVRSAIDQGIQSEGAALLGGDAEIELTYRRASDDELAWMRGISDQLSAIVDFRSMAVAGEERGLTQVKAVDDAYPLLGTVRLEPDIPLNQALQATDGNPGAVMAPALIDRLGLTIGDSFLLGEQRFTLTATLLREPDDAGGGFGLGPRTIVRFDDLANSGLLSAGSIFDTEYRLLLPEGTDLDATRAVAEDTFSGAGIRWRDSRDGAPGVSRFVDRLSSFLVIVGLSGLAVGGVGVSAAVRSYLAGKTGVIATLRTLGASRRTIFLTYFIQIAILSAIGITIGLIMGVALPLALSPLIAANLPVPAVFTIYPEPLLEAALYGTLSALLFTLWPLARTEEVRPATLFRDAMASAKLLPRWPYVVVAALLLAALVGAAVAFSAAATLTLWTAAGIAGALLVLTLAAAGTRTVARRASHRGQHGPLRWALAAVGGPQQETAAVILSLGLGLSVLAAVGQIDGNLRNAISRDLPDVAPSYFFVDIQPDQLEGFLDRVTNDPQVSRVDTAPMLRGVITQINGRPAQEVAPDHWVVRGDRGITYAAKPDSRTTVTAGQFWPEDYTGDPQISFAAEEAEELGLKLGDTLTVNVLGRDITGTITSFRDVDFSTAGIGFVLTMNPSALSGAPHTHIATVYATQAAEGPILRDISNAYPNVTAIGVRDAINRVAEVMSGIAAATSYGAGMTLLTGFLVLIGASAAGERGRTYEAAILKTIGATRGQILRSFALRAMLMGLAAGVVGLIAGIGAGWGVSHFVMETDFAVIWPSAIVIIAGGIGANLLAGLAFAWRPLAARPAGVLRARD
ncbi:FtsX-like permease family protein [Donghicola sp. C2-DW-16]|uniref:FtsX-like permease family protein n=1 Tax=Donghicola mangrovi TaxID=2729614 RepID=A0ABX2PHN8_9RHOB|nr:FtsX-like permease family protein [Donghicola mangrovi]NVO28099.1 FtsX-like permease family protein [Donghicola mangrovi]